VREGKLDDSIFVEGLRLCEEALRSGLPIEAVIFSEELARKEKAARLLDELGEVCDRLASVSEKLLESISYTKTPQGSVLLAGRPTRDEASFSARQRASPLIIVMHGSNNPVNVGAILRTAEAAGSSGVITTSADGEATHSGTYLAYLNGYGSTHTDTLSQSVTIPSGCHASLTYYLHVDSAEA